MQICQQITITCFGTTDERHVIHYFFAGKKHILQIPTEDTDLVKLSQYDAIMLAEKAEQDKINKKQAKGILHPIFQQALAPFNHAVKN